MTINADTELAQARPRRERTRELTGTHVLLILLGAFAVILTANITMIVAATGSFPGLVAKNSFVASQDFNRDAAARAGLGWDVAVRYEAGRVVAVVSSETEAAAPAVTIDATIGRPADARTDVALTLTPTGEPGRYAAEIALARGSWRIAIDAQAADGARLTGAANVFVR
ncbi:MAG: FixH family protein [Pseudomonadota bacterium]